MVIKLRIDDIYYFCSEQRKVYIHTEKRIYRIEGPLKEEVAKREGDSFIHTHHAYYVNLRHLESVGREEAVLSNGVIVPVSERKESGAKMGLKQYPAYVKNVKKTGTLTEKRCICPICLRRKKECGMVMM